MKMDYSLKMPTISVKELVEHIEEEDSFLKYGNPILIKGENDIPDTVIVNAKFYERMTATYSDAEI